MGNSGPFWLGSTSGWWRPLSSICSALRSSLSACSWRGLCGCFARSWSRRRCLFARCRWHSRSGPLPLGLRCHQTLYQFSIRPILLGFWNVLDLLRADLSFSLGHQAPPCFKFARSQQEHELAYPDSDFSFQFLSAYSSQPLPWLQAQTLSISHSNPRSFPISEDAQQTNRDSRSSSLCQEERDWWPPYPYRWIQAPARWPKTHIALSLELIGLVDFA